MTEPAKSRPRKPIPGAILTAVAEAFGVDRTVITDASKKGRSNKARSQARWAAMILLKEVWHLNPNRIAKALGGMDRTSVLHGLRQGHALIAACPLFAKALDDARTNAFAKPLASSVAAKRDATPAPDGPEPENPPVVKFEAKAEAPQVSCPDPKPERKPIPEPPARFGPVHDHLLDPIEVRQMRAAVTRGTVRMARLMRAGGAA